jgi:hypothetical protein
MAFFDTKAWSILTGLYWLAVVAAAGLFYWLLATTLL